MKHKAQTMNEYMATLNRDKRAALEKLRRDIRSAAPRSEECISYGIPAFRLGGKFLVGMGAGANHCSFYPGAYPIEAYKAELAGYDTSKGTIRFAPDQPLSVTLVRKLVKARIAEHERLYGKKGGSRGGQKARRKS